MYKNKILKKNKLNGKGYSTSKQTIENESQVAEKRSCRTLVILAQNGTAGSRVMSIDNTSVDHTVLF